MKILVTGCAGFIGFHLVKKLLNKNYDICGIDNLNSYYDIRLKKDRLAILKNTSKKKFIFYRVDIANDLRLKKIFKKGNFDIVVNLAAQAGVRYSIENPRAYVDSNIVGFFNILQNSKIFGIKHLLFASTSSVYGNQKKMPIHEECSIIKPIQFYAATKSSNELMAHSYSHLFKLQCSALRFFTVYGPWGRPDMALFKFTKNILSNKPIDVYNFGKHSRDFTYVEDVVNAISLIINGNNKRNTYEVFNIANGKSEKLGKYISLIEKEVNIKAIKNFLPLQTGDIQKTFANTNKIRKFTNFKSQTDIAVGISNFVSWYRSYYKV